MSCVIDAHLLDALSSVARVVDKRPMTVTFSTVRTSSVTRLSVEVEALNGLLDAASAARLTQRDVSAVVSTAVSGLSFAASVNAVKFSVVVTMSGPSSSGVPPESMNTFDGFNTSEL
jgi:hypothetical protein